MKKLSDEKFADVADAFAGKVYAFVEVCHEDGAVLGVAVANEAGYSPVPHFFAHGSYGEMADEAKRLNEKLGLSDMAAISIIGSSMAQGKVAI